MIHKGYFVITDISGYTSFLTTAELAHAHHILQTLLEAQIDKLKIPFVISNFQGDAILSYINEKELVEKQTLVECIEQLYFSFLEKREHMAFNSTCSCRACANVSDLDLKIFVHHGEYMIQKLLGREELIGADVILAHRMMKNKVIEQTNIPAYALFTDKASNELGLEDFCEDLIPYKDNYEHVGDVGMKVHSLSRRWDEYKENKRCLISKEDCWLEATFDIHAPRLTVWEYLTNSELKKRWTGFTTVERIDQMDGRVKEGSTFHCAHDEQDFKYKIVDWKPMEYFTALVTSNNGLVYYNSCILEEAEDSIRFSSRITYPEAGPVEESVPFIEQNWDGSFLGLKRIIEEDQSKDN